MTDSIKQAAQARANQIYAFRAELAQLQQEDLLQLEGGQQQAVYHYHEALLQNLSTTHNVDLSSRAHHLSLGMQIVSFLGAWALAASVFFFFQQYWGYLPVVGQVLLLLAVSLGSVGLTFWIAGRDKARYFAKLAAMIAFVCLVINIALLGALFNIAPSPNAFLVFALYAAMLAYALNVRLLLAVAMLCVFAFIGAYTATWGGSYWLHMGERPENFIVPALVLFAVPWFVSQQHYDGFTAIYRVLPLVALFMVLLILSNWGRSSYLPWSGGVIEGFYQTLGFVLSALAVWLGIRKGWVNVMVTGNVFFFLFLYTKFFDWWWQWLPKSVFFLLIGLTAIVALLVFSRLHRGMQQQVAQ